MFLHRLFRPWLGLRSAPARPPQARDGAGTDEAMPSPGAVAGALGPAAAPDARPPAGPDPCSPLWTQAELNALLTRLREDEDRLLVSMQAVEQELAAVLSEYASARAGASPEVKRRLQRRFQRLTLRRSGLDQLHAEQLQHFRLLDHVEADLLRRELAGSTRHDTVLGMPLARLRETLELSVARSGHRYAQLRDTVEGLDAHARDLTLADHLGLEEVEAQMNALTEAEYQHAQAQGLGEPEAWALSTGSLAAVESPVSLPARADAAPVGTLPSRLP